MEQENKAIHTNILYLSCYPKCSKTLSKFVRNS